MAMKLLNHIISDFWKEVRTLNSCRVSLPCTLDGVSGAENIAELWRQHYSSLFNPLVAPARKRRFNFICLHFLSYVASYHTQCIFFNIPYFLIYQPLPND